MEIANARSSAGNINEERREEVFTQPPPPPEPMPAPSMAPAPAPVPSAAPPPQVHYAEPPPPPPPAPVPAAAPVIINAGRDHSPSSHSSVSSYPHYHHHHHEASGAVPVGPLALAERSRSRSRSRGGREIRAEIRALERELTHRPKRDVGPVGEREIVKAERLPDGQLVVYEQETEKVEHYHKPARIEKDKKGRLSLSLPRRY